MDKVLQPHLIGLHACAVEHAMDPLRNSQLNNNEHGSGPIERIEMLTLETQLRFNLLLCLPVECFAQGLLAACPGLSPC